MKDVITRSVTLNGIRPIMFDKYAGDNKTQLPPEEKMYFGQDSQSLVIPSENIMSFLSAENTTSAPKMCYDLRKYKAVAQACKCFVMIKETEIPITRKGKNIVFSGFKDGDITLHKSVARLARGLPNPKERPCVHLPWSITFTLELFPNDVINEREVRLMFERGGISLGLGTYRGMFGKFVVDSWK